MASIIAPGLDGYIAAQQQGRAQDASNLQQALGILNAKGLLENQRQAELLHPLQAEQLRTAVETARQNSKLKGILMSRIPGFGGSSGESAPLAFGEGGISVPGGGQANAITGQTAPAAAQQGGGGDILGGVNPTAAFMMLSGDAGMGKLGTAIQEAGKPIALRPGAPAIDSSGRIIANPTPSPLPGQQFIPGPNGTWQSIPVPGAIPQAAQYAGAVSGAQALSKLPYEIHSVNTPGAPTGMTGKQFVEQATGAPVPNPYGVGAAPGSLLAGTPYIPPPQQRQTAANMDAGLKPDGSGPAIPSSAVLPPKRGMPLQSQQSTAEETHIGTELGKQYGAIIQDSAKAAVANRYLDVMQEYAKSFTPGKLAPMQSTLTQWAQALNVPVPEEAKKAAGDITALTSMAIKMAGQATRQSDAQPSQLQYFKILESMPNAERTPEGFRRIVDYLRDLNNQSIAKAQSLQEWKNDPKHEGSTEGFEAAWPAMSARLPFAWNQKGAIAAPAKTLRYNPATGLVE